MKLIFIHGAPAVGKLTVARELARLTNIPLFHNHLTVDLVTSLFEFGSEPFVRLREQVWLDVFGEAVRADTSLIFTFNPERTVQSDFVDRVSKSVRNSGGEILFVELFCSEDELEQRLTDESRKEFGKLHSLEQYRALKNEGAFEFTKLPADVSIDTTHRSPTESADIIRQALR